MAGHLEHRNKKLKGTIFSLFSLFWAGAWVSALFCALPANAQYSTQNEKAGKLYQESNFLLRERDFAGARRKLEKAIAKDSMFYEAHRMLAEIGKVMKDEALTVKHNLTITRIRPKSSETPSLLSGCARYYHNMGKYSIAAGLYQQALDFPAPLLPALKTKLERGLRSCTFAQNAIANPISFSKKPLPPTLNRFPLQYTPALTADGQTIVYTGRKGLSEKFDENIYISHKDATGDWEAPEFIPGTINTPGNEGTCGLSADGRTLVFTSCERNRLNSGCDIFISTRAGTIYSNPVAVDSANSVYWDSHPNLSADGNLIFFVSDRPGGYGKYDIYMSRKWPNGRWSQAQNLGPTINTDENEIMPFLHTNGRSLFFASNGHPGLGNFDLFVAEAPRFAGKGDFGTPRNLGYPLNTAKDESSIFITPDGKKAIYCLEEQDNGQYVSSVMYEFDLGESIGLKTKSYYVKGSVKDAQTNRPLMAKIDLADNTSGEILYSILSDSISGQYLMALPDGAQYGLNVGKKGYLFQSRFFDFSLSKEVTSTTQDFALDPLKSGAKTVLRNVFFDFGKWDLLPSSVVELNRVAKLCIENATIKVQISGYTDNVGSATDNVALSQKRAQSVFAFLQRAGVPPARLAASGLGEADPVAPNDSDEGRAINRRIEFKIL